MDVPILWDCLYEIWLSNTKQLLLDRNFLGKQGNGIAEPENQTVAYCSVFVAHCGAGQPRAGILPSFVVSGGISQG